MMTGIVKGAVVFVLTVGSGLGDSTPPPSPSPAPSPVPSPTPKPLGTFDKGAAASALANVDVQSCKRPNGPAGQGHAKITFAVNGKPSLVVVDSGPYAPGLWPKPQERADAPKTTGECVASRFSAISVPPFSGNPVTVGKSFTITP